MAKPSNGIYLTEDDFRMWQDTFTHMMNNYERCTGCESCGEHMSCGTMDLRIKSITFVVTEQCNLRCKYCYEPHKSSKRMTKQIAKDAVDFILDEKRLNGYYNFDDAKGVILEFIGGEPLLEIDLINYILEYFKFRAFELNHPWATNYVINITTNGILLKTQKVQEFIRRNLDHLAIAVTIDGHKDLHDSCRIFPDGRGSYDIVRESVKNWLKFDNSPQTKMTLAPGNINYMSQSMQHIWSIGIPVIFSNCVFEEGWNTEHAKKLYSGLKEIADYLLNNRLYGKYFTSFFNERIGHKTGAKGNWCGGDGQMLSIGVDGRCFPCTRFMQFSLFHSKEQSIGDIYKGIDNKDENEWLKELKTITLASQSPEKCLTCPISEGCAWCTGYNYDRFGTPNKRATFICVMHQARALANVYYWNKLYQQNNINRKYKMDIPKEWALDIIGEGEYKNLLQLVGD